MRDDGDSLAIEGDGLRPCFRFTLMQRRDGLLRWADMIPPWSRRLSHSYVQTLTVCRSFSAMS